VAPRGAQADRFALRAGPQRSIHTIESENFCCRGDVPVDRAQPTLRSSHVIDREERESLVILIESREDIPLDVVDIQHRLRRATRCSLFRMRGAFGWNAAAAWEMCSGTTSPQGINPFFIDP